MPSPVRLRRRIRRYDGKYVTISFKDYAKDGKTSYKTLKVMTFIARLIHHFPDKNFPMIRHGGLFASRWKRAYLKAANVALGRDPDASPPPQLPSWAERQEALNGNAPLVCPKCDQPLVFVGAVFGPWHHVESFFIRAGISRKIPDALLGPG